MKADGWTRCSAKNDATAPGERFTSTSRRGGASDASVTSYLARHALALCIQLSVAVVSFYTLVSAAQG